MPTTKLNLHHQATYQQLDAQASTLSLYDSIKLNLSWYTECAEYHFAFCVYDNNENPDLANYDACL